MTNREPLIDIHIPASSQTPAAEQYHDPKLNECGRSALLLALRERGADAVFSRGRDAFDSDDGVVSVLQPYVHGVTPDSAIHVSRLSVEIPRISAIRNTASALGENLPELNHPEVRDLVRDPRQLHDVFYGAASPLDYVTWAIGQPPEEVFEYIEGDRVRLMTGSGKNRQEFSGSKAEMIARIHAGDIDSSLPWEVDTAVDLRRPWYLEGLDDAQTERIHDANSAGLRKVLRTYVFGRDDSDVPVTRHMLRLVGDSAKPGINDLIALNPDGVPESADNYADAILQELEHRTGMGEIHLAIDWGRTGDGLFAPVGAVANEPMLADYRAHPTVAQEHAGLLADQLLRVAANGGTLYRA